MNKSAAVALTTATIAVAVLNGGAATADGGGSSSGGRASGGSAAGVWPADLPLPTSPGTVVEQSGSTAVVRSTDTVSVVMDKLDELYVTQKGCTLRLAVNKPQDFLCFNPDTRKVDEVLFTFAALDPTPSDPSLSQSNAFYFKG
jgi:hypothetical protein